ncbi:MAG: c-type cytochrome domain-containing protein [Pirellulaceae bacterium]|nr:c-type cytochrome domain-containing protein [Pirellulaceae bacterium]
MKIKFALFLVCLGASINAFAADGVSFSNQVASILVDNCVACHGAKKAEGGYRIDTFEYLNKSGDSGSAPITASKIEESELWRRLVTTDASERMPAESEPLTAPQLEIVKQWIASGAAFDGTKPNDPLYLVAPPAVYPEPPAKYSVSVPITCVAFSNDGSQVITGGYHELLCWNPNDGTLMRRIRNIGERVYAIAVSPDGTRLAVACGSPGKSGEVRIVDYASGNVVTVCGRTFDVVLDVAYSPDGTRLVAGGADGLIRVMDTSSGNVLQTIPSHADWVNALAWSDDGKKLASASRDKSAKVYTAENGELLTSYAGHGVAVKGIAFTPDGASVLSVGDDKKLHRWEIEGAKKVAEVGVGGEGYKLIRGTDFVLVPSNDKLLHRIDLGKNQETLKFAGHADWVLSSAASVKNSQIASGSIDGIVRLWNAADGTLIREWRGAP